MKSRTWITIIIIIALGVLAYFVYAYRAVLISSSTESAINKLELQSSSDEVKAIESDLSTTNLQGLDSELSDIEQELQKTGL